MTPYHPAVVHLPIALMLLSVVAEVAGRLTERPGLRATAWYALIGAAVGAALAVPLGLWDMNRFHATMSEEAHRMVEWHRNVGYFILAAILALTLWRWLGFVHPARAPGWGYVAASALALGLTLYQGWLGGEVVFKQGVGVTAPAQGEHEHSASSGPSEGGHEEERTQAAGTGDHTR